MKLPDFSSLRLSCKHDAMAVGKEEEEEDGVMADWADALGKDMCRHYAEALRRLPTSTMPELVESILRAGHCIGLLDPVSNIILNAVHQLCRIQCGGADSSIINTVEALATRSYLGSIAFMRAYFRNLSEEHAIRFLRLAGADLAVAINIAEHHQHRPWPATPDVTSGRAQLALKIAAVTARHPAPDDLAQLVDGCIVPPRPAGIAAMLEEGRCLNSIEVTDIIHFMRYHQLEATSGHSRRGRGKSGCIAYYMFCSHVSTYGDIQPRDSSIAQMHTTSMEQRLPSSLANAAKTVAMYSPNLSVDPAHEPPNCKHLKHLKMCLVDNIHAFYLEAIALLPSSCLCVHLRGILIAGHCYGPMDPVSNIILNAIWYGANFPPQFDRTVSIDPDILETQSTLCIETHSLDGLIAMVRKAKGDGFSEHMAVDFLCSVQCDLTSMWTAMDHNDTRLKVEALCCAGQAAKHPHATELASFLASIPLDKLRNLSLLITNTSRDGHDSSVNIVEQVHKQFLSPIPFVPWVHYDYDMLSATTFAQRQRFLRPTLNKLLELYAYQHPSEPRLRLVVICGVNRAECDSSTCYHVNFLATSASYSDAHKKHLLFFAEIQDSYFKKKKQPKKPIRTVQIFGKGHHMVDNQGSRYSKLYGRYGDSQLKGSFCCRLPYYNKRNPYLGRCYLCEAGTSKIVHPAWGNHLGALHDLSEPARELNYLYRCAESDSAGAAAKLDTDYVYFDYPSSSAVEEGQA